MKDRIVVDGIEYIRADLKSVGNKIVVAISGWIFVGEKIADKDFDGVILMNASNVRKWSNGRGIGGLAKEEYKKDYVLDFCGTTSIPTSAVVAIIDCKW